MISRYSDHVTSLEKMANSPEQLQLLVIHKLKSLVRRSGSVHVASGTFIKEQRFDVDGEVWRVVFDPWYWTGRDAHSSS